jgi:GTP cyclohydrolase I
VNEKPNKNLSVDTYALTRGVTSILQGIGEDPDREGLKETPSRVARFYREFLCPPEVKFTTFDNDGSDEMIIQSDIEFTSLCEHHMLFFFGSAAVAYIPNGRIVGLSKLARCVDLYSRRLQNQERITRQVAERVQKELSPKGVAVVLRARHLCMEARGVKKRGSFTTTSCLLGVFKSDPAARAEFLSLASNLKV